MIAHPLRAAPGCLGRACSQAADHAHGHLAPAEHARQPLVDLQVQPRQDRGEFRRDRAAREIAQWATFAYACEADARADAARRIAAAEFDTIDIVVADVAEHVGPYRPSRGRPRKQPVQVAQPTGDRHWRVSYRIVEADAQRIEQTLRAQATYVLIRTRDERWTIDDQEMITAYRRQYIVEQGFSWLKSTAMINPMYLKTPHRNATLGFIYCIGLMTWNLIQRNVRAYLAKNTMGLPYHRNKPSKNITTKFLFELFAGLGTVDITDQTGTRRTATVNVTDWIKLSLQALGIPESAIGRPTLQSSRGNIAEKTRVYDVLPRRILTWVPLVYILNLCCFDKMT